MERSSPIRNQLFVPRSEINRSYRKCYIVDDSEACIVHLSECISKIENLRIEATFTNPVLALNALSTIDKIDILFVDVEMPVLNGLELAQKLIERVSVLIFVSAHGHYALESFDVKAKGYLLKPYSFAKFEQALRYALEDPVPIMGEEVKAEKEYIFIKNKYKNASIVRLSLKNVIMAESVHDDIILYTTHGEYTTHISLKKLEELLTGYHNFIRIHRAFVVSLAHIAEIRKNKVAMINGTEICIGDFYRERLFNHINANLITSL